MFISNFTKKELLKISKKKWEIPYYTFFVSEFGAGAFQGKHSENDEIRTEEYQAGLNKNKLEMFEKVEGFAGTNHSILVDFYSPC